jgi:hypothetical protein
LAKAWERRRLACRFGKGQINATAGNEMKRAIILITSAVFIPAAHQSSW